MSVRFTIPAFPFRKAIQKAFVFSVNKTGQNVPLCYLCFNDGIFCSVYGINVNYYK